MMISDLVGADVENLTTEEKIYLVSVGVLRTTRLQKADEIIEIAEFKDGSFTKTILTEDNNWNGEEIASSKEEFDKLIDGGEYSIEVLDYNF